MDIEKAIDCLRADKEYLTDMKICDGEEMDIAIMALEKQIPQKPRIKTTKEVPITHNLGRFIYLYCPRCGKFIVGTYEKDKELFGGLSKKLNGCSNCLQSIDFSEWQKKESDDLVLED